MVFERNAQVTVRLSEVRPDLHGLLVVGYGLIEVSLSLERNTQVIVCLSIVGFDSYGLLVAGYCLIELAQGLIGSAEITMESGVRWIQCYRFTDTSFSLMNSSP